MKDLKNGKTLEVGELRFIEWSSYWKSAPTEPEIDAQEYEMVFSALDIRWRKLFLSSPKYIRDFYLRGDFFGDKTHVVEVNNPDILSLGFLEQLQNELRDNSFNAGWRIVIPTHLTKREVIVVYPKRILISHEYERDLAASVTQIASRMTSV